MGGFPLFETLSQFVISASVHVSYILSIASLFQLIRRFPFSHLSSILSNIFNFFVFCLVKLSVCLSKSTRWFAFSLHVLITYCLSPVDHLSFLSSLSELISRYLLTSLFSFSHIFFLHISLNQSGCLFSPFFSSIYSLLSICFLIYHSLSQSISRFLFSAFLAYIRYLFSCLSLYLSINQMVSLPYSLLSTFSLILFLFSIFLSVLIHLITQDVCILSYILTLLCICFLIPPLLFT